MKKEMPYIGMIVIIIIIGISLFFVNSNGNKNVKLEFKSEKVATFDDLEEMEQYKTDNNINSNVESKTWIGPNILEIKVIMFIHCSQEITTGNVDFDGDAIFLGFKQEESEGMNCYYNAYNLTYTLSGIAKKDYKLAGFINEFD